MQLIWKFNKCILILSNLWVVKMSFLFLLLKSLAIHVDKSACLETQVRQLVQMAKQQQSKFDLRQLLETIETIKQKVAFLESFEQRLGILGILFWLKFSGINVQEFVSAWPFL